MRERKKQKMRKRKQSVKELVIRKVVRSCRVCNTVFTQKLINCECPFCGAHQNKMEQRHVHYNPWKLDDAEKWLKEHRG